ncbi:hypothetical protein EST38_g3053 [Candolleomyces aberdarensis]|uniref:Mitochondrial distribution and morphology protein 12 n=1 Tax=Candolleomyces aberdarensis TaxID=2316362 RepID=A0A4Q2DU21_9AGAR|nr:hypothetical protein EST38_g3053 [Candolleomyces aberdarensis]
MSIDLEWPKLDSSLSSYLVEVLNKQLSNAERPSFIGPVEVTSLDFGSNAPDVELVDLRDIYRDFLDDEDDDDLDGSGSGSRPVKVTEGNLDNDDDDGFEWVSRRAAGRAAEESGMHPAYGRHLPQHIHYGFRGMPGMRTDMFSPMSQLHSPVPGSAMEGGSSSPWSAGGSMLHQSTPDLRGVHNPWDNGVGPMFRSPTPSTPFKPVPFQRSSSGGYDSVIGSAVEGGVGGPESRVLPPLQTSGLSQPPNLQQPQPQQHAQAQEQQQNQNPHPNLQLHFQINWHSNLRITITTSLLINYPSPMFMSLPIKLSVTGIVFSGEVAVAYEGERRRVHLCILDDQDPYGPAAKRDYTVHPSASASADHPDGESSVDSSPLETIPTPVSLADLDEDGSGGGGGGRPAKPLPIGQRLLPSIIIESEIGQADKHVLKNVTRIERFIQDVIRKTVEEELVFPNFHTLVMGEQ